VKEAWFRQFLSLEHGIPSQGTFGRVFALLDPKTFEACFRSWVASISDLGDCRKKYTRVRRIFVRLQGATTGA